MNSDLAIHLSECLHEVDVIDIHWRVIKQYADDWEYTKLKGEKQNGR